MESSLYPALHAARQLVSPAAWGKTKSRLPLLPQFRRDVPNAWALGFEPLATCYCYICEITDHAGLLPLEDWIPPRQSETFVNLGFLQVTGMLPMPNFSDVRPCPVEGTALVWAEFGWNASKLPLQE